ncbi:hypothetical protein TEA_015203 [Camellia sinensis var. sinensis]|uniref:Uncharacterized protein n=1 Tax=Camellia sinensis var. sinensis TaxID=542762 RepID=A0A4S4DC11_CAMSN|nr:hypothetical protein TEA_015203 [Camellia sinensis var. sinensis]
MFNYASIPGKCDMRIIETDGEDFNRVFNVNVFGAFLGAKHATRVMILAKKGTILFTSSIHSVISSCLATHACTASKHAIVGLTMNSCVQLGQYGIRVNFISLFAVVTLMMLNNMAREEKQKAEAVFSETVNLTEAMLESKDAAETTLCLASDESKYVSGLNLVADGVYNTTNPTFGEAIKKLSS